MNFCHEPVLTANSTLNIGIGRISGIGVPLSSRCFNPIPDVRVCGGGGAILYPVVFRLPFLNRLAYGLETFGLCSELIL